MNPCPRIILSGLLSAGLAATAACGASGENTPDTDMQPAPKATAADSSAKARQDACPLALAGTTSSTEDTVDGVVVTFATPNAGDKAELHRRVDRLAAAHNSTSAAATDDLAAAPPQAPGPTAAPETTPAGEAKESTATGGKLDSEAAAETSDEGVRLVLRPRDPAQLDSMRDHLRKQADDLVQRVCDQAGRKNLR